MFEVLSFIHPAPTPTPETESFWQAAQQGQFLVPLCLDCSQHHWYPRRICPHCLSSKVEWQPSAGTGKVYSFSIMRRAKVPFVLAYVTLDEGPTLLTHLVGQDPDQWQIDDPVKVQFAKSDSDYLVPVFGPDDSKVSKEATT